MASRLCASLFLLLMVVYLKGNRKSKETFRVLVLVYSFKTLR